MCVCVVIYVPSLGTNSSSLLVPAQQLPTFIFLPELLVFLLIFYLHSDNSGRPLANCLHLAFVLLLCEGGRLVKEAQLIPAHRNINLNLRF